MVPYDENPQFVGRDDLLNHLRDKLQECNPKWYKHRVAIYGMGGVGKTQCALEYVYANEKSYKRVFWISAVSRDSILSGYRIICYLYVYCLTVR